MRTRKQDGSGPYGVHKKFRRLTQDESSIVHLLPFGNLLLLAKLLCQRDSSEFGFAEETGSTVS
jgi:hypothetical protein